MLSHLDRIKEATNTQAGRYLKTGALDQDDVETVALDYCIKCVRTWGDDPARFRTEMVTRLNWRLQTALKACHDEKVEHQHETLPDETLMGYEPVSGSIEGVVAALPNLSVSERNLLRKVMYRPSDLPLKDVLKGTAGRCKWDKLRWKLQQRAKEDRL